MQDTAKTRRFLRLAALGFAAAFGLASPAAADENCRLYLSPGQADYGKFPRAAILAAPAPGGFSLGKRLLTLNVACQRPVALTLFLRGAAADDSHYGFGPQGRLALTLSQARVDGHALALGSVEQAGQLPAQVGASAQLLPGKGIVMMAGAQPGVGQKFSMQIELDASLPAAALALNAETELESGYSIEVIQH